MRNGCANHRHLAHILLGSLNTLANRIGHFAGFADSDAHAALAIADYNQRAEPKVPAALDNLGNTVDIDESFLKNLFFSYWLGNFAFDTL